MTAAAVEHKFQSGQCCLIEVVGGWGSGISLEDAFNSRGQGHCDALHSMPHPCNFYIVGMVGRRSCGANILRGTFTSWQ